MGKITATVLGIDEGFQKFEQVDMIRIKSEKYTLLIMDDYMPVSGALTEWWRSYPVRIPVPSSRSTAFTHTGKIRLNC